jgi:hypothetical protein
LHGFLPFSVESFPLLGGHPGGKFLLDLEIPTELISVFPEAHGQPGQVGGAQGGCFGGLLDDHRNAEDIRLELHKKGIGRGTAVHPQLLQFDPRILLHALQHVPRLVGDGLQAGPGDVGLGGSPRNSQDRPCERIERFLAQHSNGVDLAKSAFSALQSAAFRM